jgi:hypothetical protein
MGCIFLLFPLLSFVPAPYITTNGKPGTPDIWRKHAWIYSMSDMGSLIKKKNAD